MLVGNAYPSLAGLDAQSLAKGGVESPLGAIGISPDLLADESVSLGGQVGDVLLHGLALGGHLLDMADALLGRHLFHLFAQLIGGQLADVELGVRLATIDEVPIPAPVEGAVLGRDAAGEH